MGIVDKILGRVEGESQIDSPPPSRIMIGKIININPKGYGFISSRELEFTRIFFHWTALKPDTIHFTKLERGMMVEFETLQVEGKGNRAIKIKVMV